MTSPSDQTPPRDVTQLLLAWGGGNADAGEELLAAVYAELHSQAARAMRRENDDHTLQATALVHEAYLRLIDQRRVRMAEPRAVLRRRRADRCAASSWTTRVGATRPSAAAASATITLEDVDAAAERSTNDAVDMLALHDAIEKLAALDPDQARVVELRYFGGMSIEETAEVMGSHPRR